MDVAWLVSQMTENLSAIHNTISDLSHSEHVSRLDQLEQQREIALADLESAFHQEERALTSYRKRVRDEIASQRQREDEERIARRKREDEALAQRDIREDSQRHERLAFESQLLEDEMDEMMDEIEKLAEKSLEKGRKKLAKLEAQRKVRSAPCVYSLQKF